MSDYPYNPKVRTWDYYEQEQERRLRESMRPELWEYLVEMTEEKDEKAD